MSEYTLWNYVLENLKSYKTSVQICHDHINKEEYTKYLHFRLQNIKDIQTSLCKDPRSQELILRKDGYWVLRNWAKNRKYWNKK